MHMLNCYLKCKHLDILNHRKEEIFSYNINTSMDITLT